MALKTMRDLQQLDSCDLMAYNGVENVLEEIVHSLLLPYMTDLGISMVEVFQLGLPVLMEQLSASMQPGKCLRDLLVTFMDRLARDQDLGIAAGTALGSVLMHKLDQVAYGMSSDSGVLTLPMPLCLYVQPCCCNLTARLVPTVCHTPSLIADASHCMCCPLRRVLHPHADLCLQLNLSKIPSACTSFAAC